MSRYLVLSFRFLSPWFHGSGSEGEPEWPPSPLRAFQALVAAAARAGTLASSRTALVWLEQAQAPVIVASQAVENATGYRLSVPHNAMDIVGRQWVRGGEGNPAEHRAMKNVRPCRLPGDAVVHYVWPLLDGETSHVGTLVACARNVVALGWGLDLVVGDGALEDGACVAEMRIRLKTWQPRGDGGLSRRTPVDGTLEALERRHEAFLSRISLADSTLRPPPPLSKFAITGYARTDEQPAHRVAAFALMHLREDRFRAFDTPPRGMVVAGMVRHAARVAAQNAGWDAARIAASVMGHGSCGEPRLFLVPIPSVEYRGDGDSVGAVRRVLVFSTDPQSSDVAWAARSLAGADMVDEKTGEILAMLAPAYPSDRAFAHYLGESTTWTTVTPIVLPGHDDPGRLRERLRTTRDGKEQNALLARVARRREALVRKALRQAGLDDDLASSAQIETRGSGFLAGVERASRYAAPRHLTKSPRLHVRLSWPRPVRGPLCIGSGRFSGLGLFVRSR
jgi:CRISPR-associated protein Csb2